MRKKVGCIGCLVAVSVLFGSWGCESGRGVKNGHDSLSARGEMVARYAESPVVVDGVLDEAVWADAAVYEMRKAVAHEKLGKLQEGGEIRVAWDDDNFYLAASFDDSDIVARGEADELHHYQFGDVCELFLKPEADTWYWELYATPLRRKTTFWFAGRGRRVRPIGHEGGESGLSVGARCKGSVNDWRDRDKGWTAEMAVPVKDLRAHGSEFGVGTVWRILVARYNYSRYLYNVELSMSPQMRGADFHNIKEYGVLRLMK